LAEVLDRAAQYDAEPEYSAVAFVDVRHAMAQPDPGVRHLVIWMLPCATALGEPDHPERIVGLLRLATVGNRAAEAVIVIDPPVRSIGITTLLIEQIGLDTTGGTGWLDTGTHAVSGWARGNHPAAGRLSDRFLIPRTRRMWKLIRPAKSIRGDAGAPVLEALATGVLDDLGWVATPTPTYPAYGFREGGRIVGVVALNLGPVGSDEFGSCAIIEKCEAAPASGLLIPRLLLDGAAAIAHKSGLSGVIIHVDSDDTALVSACRSAGFQHDRTDVCFRIGG
jgi:hypothetical protein